MVSKTLQLYIFILHCSIFPLCVLDSVPPINIMAQYLSSRTLLLSWSPPPIEEQNGDIIGYGINITNIGNGNDGYMYEVTTGTSHVFTLHPFYFYIYSIAAINSVGRGPFSSPSSIQMPEDGESKKCAENIML